MRLPFARMADSHFFFAISVVGVRSDGSSSSTINVFAMENSKSNNFYMNIKITFYTRYARPS